MAMDECIICPSYAFKERGKNGIFRIICFRNRYSSYYTYWNSSLCILLYVRGGEYGEGLKSKD